MEVEHLRPITRESNSVPKRPIFINSQKWKSILKHLHQNDLVVQQTEQEKKYQEYLKQGSAEMTAKWTNSIEKARENKVAERQKREQEKILERERQFNELKERDERERLQQVAKAQEMLNRLRMGTNDLESAAVLSEVLQGREIQRNFNVELKKVEAARKRQEAVQIEMQNVAAIEEQQRRMAETKKRNDDYKCEVHRMAKEQEHRKLDDSRRQTEQERKLRDQIDKDVQGQVERERALLQRKKEAMRKNALEAMKMVEQRRLRERMENEIDNKIIDIVAKGKQHVESIRKEKERQRVTEILRIKDANAKRVFVQAMDKSAEDEERMQKAIKESNDKFEEQERQRIQRERMRKAARIKQHLEDEELEKANKARQVEHVRWSIANRLKNDQVSKEFEQAKMQEKIKRAQEIRAVLCEQMKERSENEQKERMYWLKNDECNAQLIKKDDANFMAYAQSLIEHAKRKSRPILPLVRAVDKYKKVNELDVKRVEPKHLQTCLSIQSAEMANKPKSELTTKLDSWRSINANESTVNKRIEPMLLRNSRSAQDKGGFEERSNMISVKCGQSIIKYGLDELKELNPMCESCEN